MRPRAAEIDQSGEFPRETFRAAGELGFAGVAVPESTAAREWTRFRYAIVIEEISRACANMGVILSVNNSLVCDPILKFGNEEQKKRFLAPLARGEKLGCFALTEPEAGSDAANQKTRAVRDGRRLPDLPARRFSSRAAAEADLAIVFAMTNPEKKHKRHLRVPRGRDVAGLRPVAPPGQARRQRLRDGRDLPDRRRGAGRRTGWARRETASRSPWRRSTAAASASPRRRSESPRSALRGRAPLREGAQGLRPSDRRIPGAAVLSGRHGHRNRRGAGF